MELTYICKICGFEAKNHTSLTSHLQYKHKDYTTQKYYDEFYKKENHLIRIKEYDWKNNKDLTIKELNEKLLNLVV